MDFIEDYEGAYLARSTDTKAMIDLQDLQHAICIFHLGGISIECKLKSMIVLSYKLTSWNNRHGIKNPGHQLIDALKAIPKLYDNAKKNPEFLKHLNTVFYPLGNTDLTYIDVRYSSYDMSSIVSWMQSYVYVCHWLEKQQGTIK